MPQSQIEKPLSLARKIGVASAEEMAYSAPIRKTCG